MCPPSHGLCVGRVGGGEKGEASHSSGWLVPPTSPEKQRPSDVPPATATIVPIKDQSCARPGAEPFPQSWNDMTLTTYYIDRKRLANVLDTSAGAAIKRCGPLAHASAACPRRLARRALPSPSQPRPAGRGAALAAAALPLAAPTRCRAAAAPLPACSAYQLSIELKTPGTNTLDLQYWAVTTDKTAALTVTADTVTGLQVPAPHGACPPHPAPRRSIASCCSGSATRLLLQSCPSRPLCGTAKGRSSRSRHRSQALVLHLATNPRLSLTCVPLCSTAAAPAPALAPPLSSAMAPWRAPLTPALPAHPAPTTLPTLKSLAASPGALWWGGGGDGGGVGGQSSSPVPVWICAVCSPKRPPPPPTITATKHPMCAAQWERTAPEQVTQVPPSAWQVRAPAGWLTLTEAQSQHPSHLFCCCRGARVGGGGGGGGGGATRAKVEFRSAYAAQLTRLCLSCHVSLQGFSARPLTGRPSSLGQHMPCIGGGGYREPAASRPGLHLAPPFRRPCAALALQAPPTRTWARTASPPARSATPTPVCGKTLPLTGQPTAGGPTPTTTQSAPTVRAGGA